MASKNVTITPQAAIAAGCSATCESYYHDVDSSRDMYYYQLVATRSSGWRFKKFTWKLYRNGTLESGTTTSRSELPPSPPSIWDPYAGLLIEGWTEYVTPRQVYELTDIVAEFEPVTNLLINSAICELPVKLVYDPTTNRLVADY